MTLVESGAEQLIAQFGVTVEVYPQDSQSPENASEPVFFEDTDNDSTFTEYDVRLYTSASEEMMKDYGLDEGADSLMYSTSDIASQGDKVKYPKGNYEWIVEERMTNQITDSGPYIFVYSMGAI